MVTISKGEPAQGAHIPAVPVQKEKLADGLYLFTLEAPRLAELARPGQFVHLRVGTTADPLLRRPFSIHRVDRARGLVFLLVRATGRGTGLLTGATRVDLLGPLGRGFAWPAQSSALAVVAGGMGAAPLVFLLQELAGHEVRVFAGARSGSLFPALHEVAGAGFPFYPATDDGSLGFAGSVTDLFRRETAGWRPDLTMACGPPAMLRSLCGVLGERGLAGQVSLESHMACGVGACQGCAVRVNGGYSLVCSDGPVFAAEEVEWS
ncbi:MAG TPA: dihydroorotate dehydrogenase electron transfer subunit [Spirochaetia bacterium]|nr:dihydroorotate dehydrogenase electron transfer subunit [Spirochaetia bacterium]